MKPLRFLSLSRVRIIVWSVIAVVLFGVLINQLVARDAVQGGLFAHHSAKHPVPVVKAAMVVGGLHVPTDIVATPYKSDKRLFVVEQTGDIRVLNSSGALESAPFLDIHDKVLFGGEMGLLGLAFSPHYNKDGFFYINYINHDQETIIARYHVAQNVSQADPVSEKILFRLKQPYQNHNGGDLAFGPDGYLYIALGDGGSGGDPQNRAQDKSSYFGKLLRIDVAKGDPYAIPGTNPFTKEAGAKPEIWAYGLRNPWRINFDSRTGDLYIADVGQGKYEEIDVQPAASKGGENYGWRCYEGSHAFTPDGCKDASAYATPALEYDHQEKRCSITGGYVYRGSRYTSLVGKYFYADFCNGQLFYARRSGDKLAPTLALQTPYMISTFGQGSDGELYFAEYQSGSIYHLEDANVE